MKFIKETEQWKKQCQYLLNISANGDPMDYLPKCSSYKDVLKLVLSRILGEDIYRHYLGVTPEPAPRIPESISLKKFNDPDPFTRKTRKIGQNYFWVYYPEYFELTVEGDSPFYLDKEDDPNDQEAPRLILKENKAGLLEWAVKKIGLVAELEKRVLRVPNTINNINTLFKHPKHGHPSFYKVSTHIFPDEDHIISREFGNKRTRSKWMCMRKDAIGKYKTFSQQQKTAEKAGAVIPSLFERITFNLAAHVTSNIYPDGDKLRIIARTDTLLYSYPFKNSSPMISVFACGKGDSSGLDVKQLTTNDKKDLIGAAVAFTDEISSESMQR
ncbi:MAG TPA: hypothetical protein VLG49_02525 [Rhabdochlamydiaceae bacterium]|nr:hypothetical protein [Rhabdochlamydiaceae bacterium]